MGDVKVQRGTAAITNAGGTVAPGTAFGSLASAFVRNTNNRRTHGGRDDETVVTLDGDDASGTIELTATNTITFTRESASDANAMRFAWESWEYVGTAGGPHEFIVRSRNTVTFTSGQKDVTVVLDNAATNKDRCIPFITGIRTNSSADDADSQTAIAWLTSTTGMTVRRGSSSSPNTTVVQIVVVEFTGSAWQVAHGRIESSASTGTITLVDAADGQTAGGGVISDWGTAIIFHQYKANDLDGVDDAIADTSATYYPSTSTTVSWAFHSNHVDSATAGQQGEHFVHVLSNGGLAVSRFTDTQSLTGVMNVNVASAGLTALDEASVEVSRSSSGTGTAYMRGWVNARLTSLTNVELWVHRSGNTIDTRIQVIDLTGLGPVIIATTDTLVDDGDTDISITGAGFGATQGTGKVEIGTQADYSGTNVEQTVATWSDTSITYDFVRGGLSDGTAYLFVTNNAGDRSAGKKISIGEQAYEDFVVSLGPDHYWPFNGDYGDVVSGNAANNTQTGTPSFTASPLTRGRTQALQLNGLTDSTEASDTSAMNASAKTKRTMFGWIKVAGVQQPLSAIYKEGGGVNNFAFLMGYGNVLMAQAADTGDDYAQAYGDVKLTPNRVYQICFQFTAGGGNFELYLDGILQTDTSGNPWTPPDMDSHVGDIVWGDPDTNLEVGGTDIAFQGPEDCLYNDWASWSETGQLTPAQIRETFVRGAVPVDELSGTSAQQQVALDALQGTAYSDVPMALKIRRPTDTASQTLTLKDITFDSRVSCHILWMGRSGETLTIRNSGTSNADVNMIDAPDGGSVSIIETAGITLTVKDVDTGAAIEGAIVRVEADTGGPLAQGTLIFQATTGVSGTVSGEIDYTADQPIKAKVRKASAPTYYKPLTFLGTVTVEGLTSDILMVKDE